MLRRVLVLLVLGAVLLAIDSSQRSAAAGERQESLRVLPLVGDPQAKSRQIAYVRVEDGDGHVILYGIDPGHQWRCLNWKGAPALGAKIEQMALDVLGAHGVILSEQPPRPADYGLGTSAMRVISLHGAAMKPTDPSSDLIASVDIGAPVVGADGCYARVHGKAAIWTVDVDPASVCGREPTPRPSLVDPALVPAGWQGEGGPRLLTMNIALPNRPAAQLEMVPRELTPEEAEKGEPGINFMLKAGGPASVAPLPIAMAYANYVLSAPWSDVVDPALVPKLDFEHPRAVLTLTGTGTPPMHLLLGARTPTGRSAVQNDFNKLVFEIEPAQETLLFPPATMFASSATANPWAPPQPPTMPQLPGK